MPTTRTSRDGFRMSDVLAVALIVIFAVLPFPDETFRGDGLLLIPGLAPAVVVPFRRRWPLASLGVSLACVVAVAAAGSISPSALLAVAISCFAVLDRLGRRIGLLALGVSVVVAVLANGWALGGDLFDSTALQFVLLIVLGGALGDTARSRREFATAMTERAERAERSRDDEARRRVAEDRVRIARDLHDVVAHQIAVISLNAGVASSSLETRPERAREALTTVRSASRTVLADIGGLLTLLRADGSDGSDDEAELRPQRGLSDLDALLSGFRGAGLRVDLRRGRREIALSPGGDHVAYLVLHEALTNAHKHGRGGTATVAIRAEGAAVHLTIVNPTATESSPPAVGNGLRGLQERIAAVGGAVHFGSEGGVFSLEAWIPTAADTSS
ncbi:signal transduction histidine kinase [Microbacterium phyllosphaerae]|uniref:histidine kinase n=1 Tax=Microbacterium phyllosphaerae TaxID=124798 RepID=A0ABS4WRJ5_9MICO|nr:histidine kinase [Microbacterium phyllosphaerae]MBP2378837.1 signal transduction histidine kinase [Microbacterium phyllosphaerae]